MVFQLHLPFLFLYYYLEALCHVYSWNLCLQYLVCPLLIVLKIPRFLSSNWEHLLLNKNRLRHLARSGSGPVGGWPLGIPLDIGIQRGWITGWGWEPSAPPNRAVVSGWERQNTSRMGPEPGYQDHLNSVRFP